MNKILDLIRSIPPSSEIPCLCLFRGDDCYEKCFIVSYTFSIYLKHNNIDHKGSGMKYKDFKYSWFLYRYKTKEYDLDGIVDISLDICSIPLGEL